MNDTSESPARAASVRRERAVCAGETVSSSRESTIHSDDRITHGRGRLLRAHVHISVANALICRGKDVVCNARVQNADGCGHVAPSSVAFRRLRARVARANASVCGARVVLSYESARFRTARDGVRSARVHNATAGDGLASRGIEFSGVMNHNTQCARHFTQGGLTPRGASEKVPGPAVTVRW